MTWTARTKPTNSWVLDENARILEDGSFLLNEDGGFKLLEKNQLFWQSDRDGLWSSLYFPWLSELPWQKTSINTNWTPR